MAQAAYRWRGRLLVVSSCMAAVMTVLMLLLLITYGSLLARVAYAEEQSEMFDLMCREAHKADVKGALECLEYTAGYYPSGTKQVTGSRLDAIVERCRRNAVDDIIEELRRKTGKDFGSDPEDWDAWGQAGSRY